MVSWLDVYNVFSATVPLYVSMILGYLSTALRLSAPFSRRWNYCARMWFRQICSISLYRCVSFILRRLKHRRFFTESTMRLSTWSCYLYQRLSDVLLKSNPYSSSLHWCAETLVHQSQDLTVCRSVNIRTVKFSKYDFRQLLSPVRKRGHFDVVRRLITENIYKIDVVKHWSI